MPEVVASCLNVCPTVTLAVVRPEEAQEMRDAVNGAVGAGFLQSWPFDGQKTLVAYAGPEDDWNAIAAIARIDVLAQQRRSRLVFPPQGSAAGRALPTINAAWTLAAVVGITLALWAFAGCYPLGENSN